MTKKLLAIIAIVLLIAVQCSDDEDTNANTNLWKPGDSASGTIIASQGGSVSLKDYITITFSPYAISHDVTVAIEILDESDRITLPTVFKHQLWPFKVTFTPHLQNGPVEVSSSSSIKIAVLYPSYSPVDNFADLAVNSTLPGWLNTPYFLWTEQSLTNRAFTGDFPVPLEYRMDAVNTPSTEWVWKFDVIGMDDWSKDTQIYLAEDDEQIAWTDRIPLILIHGYNYCNCAPWEEYNGMWDNFLNLHREMLSERFKIMRFNFDIHKSLIESANDLKSLIATEIPEANADKIVILAYDIGGLVAKEYVLNGRNDDVLRVVTLGSPFNGVPFATAPSQLVGTASAKQLYPYSSFISRIKNNSKNNLFINYAGDLYDELDPITWTTDPYELLVNPLKKLGFAHTDGWVPVESAMLDDAIAKRTYHGYSHLRIVAGGSVHDPLFDQITTDLMGTVNTKPVAELLVEAPASRVVMTPFMLDASGSTDNEDELSSLQFSWRDTDNPTWSPWYTVPNLQPRYPKPGKKLVELRVMDTGGLIGTAVAEITVLPADNRPPTAIFDPEPTSGTAPLEVRFDASESYDIDVDAYFNEINGVIVQYHWDFGDGSYTDSYLPVTVHEFTNKGSITITLTVTDFWGLTGLTRRTITVQ
jgi:hypothetical protein